jgi:hypothetical protein
VLLLGATASEMGVLRALEYAPSLMSLPFGVLVDRSRRCPLLIATNLLQAPDVVGALTFPTAYYR